MIDSIFIIDDNDEVLIERHWKGLVSRLVINTYISYRHNTKNAVCCADLADQGCRRTFRLLIWESIRL